MANWTADRSITVEDVSDLLTEAGRPSSGSVVMVAEGFDNVVFAAGDEYVRAARRKVAIPDLAKEIRLLPLLADIVPLAIPVPTFVPPGFDGLEWPWFMFAPVVGREVGAAMVERADLTDAASALGHSLRILHRPSLADQVKSWVREDEFRRTDMPYRAQMAAEQVEGLLKAGYDEPEVIAELRNVIAAAKKLPVLPNTTLVHGDMHLRHLFVDQASAPVGIIDWGDAHIGHPACDLSAGYALFTGDERRAFFEAYGQVDDETLLAAKLVALYIAAVLWLSAPDFGVSWLREAAAISLGRVVET